MNKEEVKEIFDHNWTKLVNPDYSDDDLAEAQNWVIETLSAELQGFEEYLKQYLGENDLKIIGNDVWEETKAKAEQTEWISVKEAYTKGEWLFEPTQNINNPWKCSCCGHRAGRYKYKTYKFCPWCGAKMDKGKEETQRPYKEYQDLRTGEYVREYKGEE